MKPMDAMTLRRAVTKIAGLLTVLFTRSARDRSRAELAAMGERELLDIAIGRCEIPYLLYRARDS